MVGNRTGLKEAAQAIEMLPASSLAGERRSDKTQGGYSGQYTSEPRYFVGIDRMSTFRERIQEIYGDNPEITDALCQLDEYFSDCSFEDSPGVKRFVGRVRRSVEKPLSPDEIATELIDQGYITALKKLGYGDAPANVAFSKSYAEERGISFAEAFMFGPGGAARIALAEWLIDERLHGMHRSGKGPGSAFSEQARQTWYAAEYKHRSWPYVEDQDGDFSLAEVPAELGKLPDGAEELMRDSWRRYLRKGRDFAYTGMRPLRCGQNYQMIEDMVCVLLEDEGGPKTYRSPLNCAQQLRYNQIIEGANKQGIEPFYAVYGEMFTDSDNLRPIWDKARRILYEHSAVLREASMDAGLIQKPDSIGITWRNRHRAWQAQIACKGRQKYLGLFKNKADAREAYYKAAARMGHIPGMPDMDKIWPDWTEEKERLKLMRERPRMPIVYQQQDTHKERKSGLRPPEAMWRLVERMKGVDWLIKHCLLTFDDDWPAATQDIAIKSRGRRWYQETSKQGKRFVIQGCTSIDKDTDRIGITIYRPGFDNGQVLAEEVYHVVFGIVRQAHLETYQAARRWYESCLKKGADPTVSLDEAFSKSMGQEESGIASGLPRSVVKHARNIFSGASDVPGSVMEKVKTR